MVRGTGLIVLVTLSMTLVSGVSGILSFYQTFPSRNENNEVTYEYRYSVDDQRSGVVNDRWEQRVGQFVKGSYSLVEPGGKVRTVSYEVDGKRGFKAVVRTHFPAGSLQSIQQFQLANQLFPDPAVNLRRSTPPPPPANNLLAASRFQSPNQGFQSGFQGGGKHFQRSPSTRFSPFF